MVYQTGPKPIFTSLGHYWWDSHNAINYPLVIVISMGAMLNDALSSSFYRHIFKENIDTWGCFPVE